MKMSGAAILVEELARQNVDIVFGYPGGYVINIYDELYKNARRITHITTAGEQGAAFAADAYARASGKTGVVLATGGPGATNLVTGIACAYLDSVPVVYITGNVAVPMLGQDAFQDIDIVGVTMPIIKHSYVVKDIETLQQNICEAFVIANTGRKGPVHIDIPKDVQLGEYEYDPDLGVPDMALSLPPLRNISKNSAGRSRPGEQSRRDDIDAALKLISRSKRPFIYCGGGVTATSTGAEIMRLSERLGAPIGMSMMGIGSVPSSYERNLGMSGMHGRYASIAAMSESDLIIAAGVRFSDRATGSASEFQQNTAVIHIDIDAAEIGKNIKSNVSLCGDLRGLLPQLLEGLEATEPKTCGEWAKRVEALKTEETSKCGPAVRKNDKCGSNCLSPKDIISCVNAFYGDDTCVATDVGQHQMWVAAHYRFEKPRTLISSGGLGAMGYGLGAAIGACLARGRKRTVLFTGDGSFGMNMNEMATAVTLGLPITVILINNSSLGMVRQWQTLFFDKRYSNTTLERKTDFPALAKAFGAEGVKADTIAELERALAGAPDDKPCLIECIIDIDEMVLPMIPTGGTMDDIIL